MKNTIEESNWFTIIIIYTLVTVVLIVPILLCTLSKETDKAEKDTYNQLMQKGPEPGKLYQSTLVKEQVQEIVWKQIMEKDSKEFFKKFEKPDRNKLFHVRALYNPETKEAVLVRKIQELEKRIKELVDKIKEFEKK